MYAIVDGIRVEMVVVSKIVRKDVIEFHISFNPPLTLVDDVRSALKQNDHLYQHTDNEISLKRDDLLWHWRLENAF